MGNSVRYKQRIVISDYIFAGSLAATGGGLSMGTEGKHRKQKQGSCLLSWPETEQRKSILT